MAVATKGFTTFDGVFFEREVDANIYEDEHELGNLVQQHSNIMAPMTARPAADAETQSIMSLIEANPGLFIRLASAISVRQDMDMDMVDEDATEHNDASD